MWFRVIQKECYEQYSNLKGRSMPSKVKKSDFCDVILELFDVLSEGQLWRPSGRIWTLNILIQKLFFPFFAVLDKAPTSGDYTSLPFWVSNNLGSGIIGPSTHTMKELEKNRPKKIKERKNYFLKKRKVNNFYIVVLGRRATLRGPWTPGSCFSRSSKIGKGPKEN